MLGYGRVRPLSETFRLLKLVPPVKPNEMKNLSEGRDGGTEEKEKLERRRLIEQARHERSGSPEKKSEVKKSKLEVLLEEIGTIEREIQGNVAGANSPASPDLKECLDCLEHVEKFSENVVKRYGWRSGEKEEAIAEAFAAIRDEAKRQRRCITKGEVREENTARSESQKLVKQFVEMVGVIKDQFRLNESFYAELKKWAETVR